MLRFVVFVLLYLLAAFVATKSLHGPGLVPLFWPASGLAFGIVLRYGVRWIGYVAFSVLVMHLWFVPAPPTFIFFSIAGNCLGMYLGARYAGRLDAENQLRLRTGFRLLRASIINSAICALVGVTGMLVTGVLASNELWPAIAKWSMGDLLGIVSITPSFLMFTAARPSNPDLPTTADFAERREKTLWLVALVCSYLLVFWGGSYRGSYALGMVTLPTALLVWSAIRFPPHWTAAGTAATVLFLTTLTGLGLAGYTPPDQALDAAMLLGFLSILSVIPLILVASSYSGRVATRKALRRATTDAATGLPNRVAFEEAMQETLGADGVAKALAYLDLDHLSLINDTTSHTAGDALIHGVGSLLKARLHRGDQVFRISGDEFALLLDGDPDTVEQRALEMVRAIESYRVGWQEHVLNITVSVGLVPFVTGNVDFARLLSLADAACFTAKELGGNRVCRATQEPGETQERTEAMRWAVRIREALDREQFELDCQTIAPLNHQAGIGRHFEVLLRLRDPATGQRMLPSQFIPAAERFQLGVALDRHVVNLALGWLENRPDATQQIDLCAINLTAASLVDEGFSNFLFERVRNGYVAPRKLCFEITETSAVRDLSRAQGLINRMRLLGCVFALDDFGTGFCSFNYLRTLDVDYFKIDGSFVHDLETSPLSTAIIRSITDIAHVLRKKTIAEQTESESVCAVLRALGVDYAQGFAIHKPQPIGDYFSLAASLKSFA
jgi:diguanylate cyclase (GGDEF)-like protein